MPLQTVEQMPRAQPTLGFAPQSLPPRTTSAPGRCRAAASSPWVVLAVLAWLASLSAIAGAGVWLAVRRRGGRGRPMTSGEYLLATMPPGPAGPSSQTYCLASSACDVMGCDVTVQPCDELDPNQRWILSSSDSVVNRRTGVSIAADLEGHGRATGVRALAQNAPSRSASGATATDNVRVLDAGGGRVALWHPRRSLVASAGTGSNPSSATSRERSATLPGSLTSADLLPESVGGAFLTHNAARRSTEWGRARNSRFVPLPAIFWADGPRKQSSLMTGP